MRANASPSNTAGASSAPDPALADDLVLSDDAMSYTVSAIPASFVLREDLIIRDTAGRAYLLSLDAPQPVPLAKPELDVLGMAYEPAQDTSWHSYADLRRMFFGAEDA